MKKLLLLSAVLLGAASASQAGVHLDIGLPLPPLPLPGIIFGRPTPRAYYDAPRSYYAPPVCEAPPYYDYDSPVIIAPPRLSFGFGPRYYGYHDYDRHHYSYRGDYRGRDYRGGDHRDYRGGDHRGGHYDGHHYR